MRIVHTFESVRHEEREDGHPNFQTWLRPWAQRDGHLHSLYPFYGAGNTTFINDQNSA